MTIFKKAVALTVLVVFALTSASCFSITRSGWKKTSKARSLLDEGGKANCEEALKLAEQSLNYSKNSSYDYELSAEIFARCDQYDRAVEVMAVSVRKASGSYHEKRSKILEGYRHGMLWEDWKAVLERKEKEEKERQAQQLLDQAQAQAETGGESVCKTYGPVWNSVQNALNTSQAVTVKYRAAQVSSQCRLFGASATLMREVLEKTGPSDPVREEYEEALTAFEHEQTVEQWRSPPLTLEEFTGMLLEQAGDAPINALTVAGILARAKKERSKIDPGIPLPTAFAAGCLKCVSDVNVTVKDMESAPLDLAALKQALSEPAAFFHVYAVPMGASYRKLGVKKSSWSSSYKSGTRRVRNRDYDDAMDEVREAERDLREAQQDARQAERDREQLRRQMANASGNMQALGAATMAMSQGGSEAALAEAQRDLDRARAELAGIQQYKEEPAYANYSIPVTTHTFEKSADILLILPKYVRQGDQEMIVYDVRRGKAAATHTFNFATDIRPGDRQYTAASFASSKAMTSAEKAAWNLTLDKQAVAQSELLLKDADLKAVLKKLGLR